MRYCFRLEYGADLKKEIGNFCTKNNIEAACVLCCVGCVYQANIRLADGHSVKMFKDLYEIVSLTGTYSKDGMHFHISFADYDGHTFGGHLMENTLINTTAEIVLESLDEYEFSRIYEEKTGYKELVIKRK